MSFTLLEPSSINSTATFSFANLTVSGSIALTGANSNNNLGNAVTANYFIGNGALLTNISSSNITGQVPNSLIAGTVYTNAQPNITSVGTLSSLTVTSNISAGNLTGATYVAGTLTTAAQPNITSLGTLTSLSVSGNITSNNASLGNLTTSNYFSGNGSLLTSITGANVSGYVPNANVANSATTAGTVTTASQSNITSVGTLLGLSITGNLNITGNINATGNINYSNVTDLVVGDPLVYIGENNTGNLYDLGIVASYNDSTYYHTGIARDATDGIWKLFDKVVAEPTTTIDFANGTYAPFRTGNITTINASLGNLTTSNYFSGNGSLLTSITGANVTGQVSNALIAGTVYTNAQPNITSVGTLSSLTVTGNISAGNLTGATYVTGTLTTAAQPNITSVGSLTSLSVSGYANFTDTTTFRSSQDVTISGTPSGTVNYDLYNGTLFDVSPTANWTANVANIPTTNNRTTVVIFIITQGSTAYVPNVFQISGSTQTVKWLSNTTPSGTSNKIDVISYSLVRSNSGTWTVLGQSATYG